MPAFETMDRVHTAVLWPATGKNELGQYVVGSPVQDIKVQWDDRRNEMLDNQGNVVSVDATVFSNRDIPMGSIMRKGSYSDWMGTGSGADLTDLMQVKMVQITDDLKGRNRVYFYGLMRYTDTLPTS